MQNSSAQFGAILLLSKLAHVKCITLKYYIGILTEVFNLGHICGEVTLFQTTILLFILTNFVCSFVVRYLNFKMSRI